MSGVEATRAESPEEGDSREERIATRRKRVTVKIEADRRAALGEEPEKAMRCIMCMHVHTADKHAFLLIINASNPVCPCN